MSEVIHITIDSELKEIMPTFLENRQKDLIALDSFLATMDISAIQTIGHRLAGNAGSYGLHDLGHIGAAIEEACLMSSEDAIRKHCKRYSQFIANLKISYSEENEKK